MLLSFVILSEAKNLCCFLRTTETLRFAQGDIVGKNTF
jgi:hypothetical protein